MFVDGNVYYGPAIPFVTERHKLVDSSFSPNVKIIDEGENVYLIMNNKNLKTFSTSVISTFMLGKAKLPKQCYENPDGSPIVLNYDYLGNIRGEHPTSGPLELLSEGESKIKIW